MTTRPKTITYQWTCHECPFQVKGLTEKGVRAKAALHEHHPGFGAGRILLPGEVV